MRPGVTVACLGDVMLDVIVEAPGGLVPYDDTPAEITFAAGGQAANVATWVSGTAEGDWTSVALPSDGSYGVPEGLISSFPARSVNGQWQIVQGLEIDDFSRGRIDASVTELLEERDAVQALGLV